ncbi:hypothetical protein R3W88_000777 [Solanum pinnatisectum]|uniref:Uncharacterized protein n=1 Tax=Solanum pinnatisectum TaxID=50273 RepID=A0AAV9MGD8_9SOLN|nr:hypothetical protein R3W88_000777 [Solanum pinnatisectum]
MNVCRPHGGSKWMILGYFVVLFRCAFLWTMLLAIFVLALQSEYWISPSIKKRGFAIFSCMASLVIYLSMNFSFLPNQRVPSLFVKTTVVWKFSTMIKFSTSVFVLCGHKVFSLDAYFLG